MVVYVSWTLTLSLLLGMKVEGQLYPGPVLPPNVTAFTDCTAIQNEAVFCFQSMTSSGDPSIMTTVSNEAKARTAAMQRALYTCQRRQVCAGVSTNLPTNPVIPVNPITVPPVFPSTPSIYLPKQPKIPTWPFSPFFTMPQSRFRVKRQAEACSQCLRDFINADKELNDAKTLTKQHVQFFCKNVHEKWDTLQSCLQKMNTMIGVEGTPYAG